MNIKLSHCQLIIAICRSVMPCIQYILTILSTLHTRLFNAIARLEIGME